MITGVLSENSSKIDDVRNSQFCLIADAPEKVQGYSQVPPGFPNSTAQQLRQTRQKEAYQ